jgi:hypothetical protein
MPGDDDDDDAVHTVTVRSLLECSDVKSTVNEGLFEAVNVMVLISLAPANDINDASHVSINKLPVITSILEPSTPCEKFDYDNIDEQCATTQTQQ